MVPRSIRLSYALCLVGMATLALWGLGCAGTEMVAVPERVELVNTALPPPLSHWLIGPISRMATPAEVQAYRQLASKDEAEAFIDRFWAERDPRPDRPLNPLRQVFEERVAEADRKFSQAGYPGHRTDRGTVWVLYGEPEDIEYGIAAVQGGPPPEIWTYPAGHVGLHGQSPDPMYHFVQRGDLKVWEPPNRRDPRWDAGRLP